MSHRKSKVKPDFTLHREMLLARQKAARSQSEISAPMCAQSPSVTRLKSSLSSEKHSPSLDTIKKYANALDCHLEIKLVRNKY